MKQPTPITHFVINYIDIEDISKHEQLIPDGRIIVGVTDNVRWENAIKIGDSGINELTWMQAIITENGTQEQRYSSSKSIDFYSYHPDGPIHALMHQYITQLLQVAHQIREAQLTQAQARNAYFGYKLSKKSCDYDTQAYF